MANKLLRPTRFDLGGRGSTLGTDALQHDAGWLIVRVLRHEFAPERLDEDGLVKMIDQLAGAGCLGRERSIQARAVSMRRQCTFRLYYIESQEGLVPQPP